jgi:hypothetical protein
VIGTGSAGDTGSLPSLTLVLPAGVAAGDQIIVAVRTDNTRAVPAPSGYTTVSAYAPNQGWRPRMTLLRRTATGGETSVVLPIGYFAKSGVVSVYRGVNTTAPIGTIVTAAGDGTSFVMPTLTVGATGGRLMIAAAAQNHATAAGWTPPSGMSVRVQQSTLAWQASGLMDQTVTAGATGTRTVRFGASSSFSGVMFVLQR